MKVFVGWSGQLSHSVALVLKEWLPAVVDNVEPWVSSEDIDKGTVWNAELKKALGEAQFGVICLTPDNIGKPVDYVRGGRDVANA